MHDVRPQLGKQAPQRADVTQCAQRLAAQVHGDVLAALRSELLQQPAAAGNHDRAMSRSDKGAAYLEHRTLDATRIQRRQQLHDGEMMFRHIPLNPSTCTVLRNTGTWRYRSPPRPNRPWGENSTGPSPASGTTEADPRG